MIDTNLKKYLIIITGPTAVGKSSMTLALAKSLNADILSADSRQVYRELNIGVAKPSIEELNQVNHHFINHTSIAEIYSAGQFEREAISRLENYYKSNNIMICAGGTGLYIDALRFGLDTFPKVDHIFKDKYEALLLTSGIEELQSKLKIADPKYYESVDIQNSARLIRALSVIESSGKPFSSFLNSGKAERSFEIIPIVLTRDRDQLYHRINRRVDQMMEQGLEKEVQDLYLYRNLPTLKTVGYQEFFPYIKGEISLTQAVDKIKQKTRNYAKRQTTWFKKHGPWNVINADDYNTVKNIINNKIF